MARGRKTGGRSKGTPNKFTTSIKEMVETALSNAGGVDYLTQQAHQNPVAFLAVVAKLIPRDLNVNMNITDSLAERVRAARERLSQRE